ncbi:MAG: aspartate kinase [Flavobacteriaceae bacterium]|nr:aspartate kinase [Flavobacteriaceae bacterium]
MRVYKFGGASVKDATGVKNVKRVLELTGARDVLVVVSAMGKTTRHLQEVVNHYFNDQDELEAAISAVYNFHQEILSDLFPQKSHIIYEEVSNHFKDLRGFLGRNKSPKYAFVFDQVVSLGEKLSSAILSHFLLEQNIKNTLLDSRQCIKTDSSYREAKVNWEVTQKQISQKVNKKGITISQGFIGADDNNFTTTLGFEGSDYTAAIFAYCLNAVEVTIWKDVPGVLNADPRHFKDPQLLHQISYREAIELAFYGASVLHPKTLQPLQRKEIPLYVKSFLNPLNKGTCVTKGAALTPYMPCFILKKKQVLISMSSLDFSFIMEDSISEVFKLLHKFRMKMELVQNSAISFSVCVDNTFNNLQELIACLKTTYEVNYNENVILYTLRHSKPEDLEKFTQGKTVLLKQESRETVQLIIKD